MFKFSVCRSNLRNSPWYLTHWSRDKIATISQTTSSNAFSWMKMYEFLLRFHWSLFLRFELKRYSSIGPDNGLAPTRRRICVTQPQWVDGPLSSICQHIDIFQNYIFFPLWKQSVSIRFEWQLASMWQHDDVIEWKLFPCYWPFVRGFHRWIPHTKASDAGPLIFSLICVWINSWVVIWDAIAYIMTSL